MRLVIQNMVCDRCVESVQSIFSEADIPLISVELGSVELAGEMNSGDLQRISDSLKEKGFLLARDRETELVEQIRVRLLEYVHQLEKNSRPEKLSVFMAENLHYNYSYLSKVFSEKMNETIEGYLIRLKIERVKELLSYRTLTLSEIAWQLNYSSVQYLSNQFKKITGKTVTDYLKQEKMERNTMDRV